MKGIFLLTLILCAACLILAGCTKKPPETTPPPVTEPALTPDFDPSIYTDSLSLDSEYPKLYAIRSVESLIEEVGDEDYKANFSEYDKAYFEKKLLLRVTVWEPSGSITHTALPPVIHEDYTELQIMRHVPEMGTCDEAQRMFFFELEHEHEGTCIKISTITDTRQITTKTLYREID